MSGCFLFIRSIPKSSLSHHSTLKHRRRSIPIQTAFRTLPRKTWQSGMLNSFHSSGSIGLYSDGSRFGRCMTVNPGVITGPSPAELIIPCCSTDTASQSLRSMPLSRRCKGNKKQYSSEKNQTLFFIIPAFFRPRFFYGYCDDPR